MWILRHPILFTWNIFLKFSTIIHSLYQEWQIILTLSTKNNFYFFRLNCKKILHIIILHLYYNKKIYFIFINKNNLIFRVPSKFFHVLSWARVPQIYHPCPRFSFSKNTFFSFYKNNPSNGACSSLNAYILRSEKSF